MISRMDVVSQTSAIIKQCVQNCMHERNLSTLQRTVSVDNNSENAETRVNAESNPVSDDNNSEKA